MIQYDDTYFVKRKSRRIYYTKDPVEAFRFARMFSGTVFQYLPNVWRVQI